MRFAAMKGLFDLIPRLPSSCKPVSYQDENMLS